jgi:hypothetical protein
MQPVDESYIAGKGRNFYVTISMDQQRGMRFALEQH